MKEAHMFSDEEAISVLNVIPEHLCIIDLQGKILFVNKAWIDFEYSNTDKAHTDWLDVNYLDVCDKSLELGYKFAKKAAQGIRAVANKNQSVFKIEYPCHSPEEKRWFELNCIPFTFMQEDYLLLQHINITQKIEASINTNVDTLTLVEIKDLLMSSII
jgi:hypothetical protein